MKAKFIYTLVVVCTLAAANAQDTHTSDANQRWREAHPNADSDYQMFRAGEFSLDLFGTYMAPEGKFDDLFNTNIRHGNWGGGAGVNFFFLRYVGIGTDASISQYAGNEWHFDRWLGDLYLRLPLGDLPVAPYIVGSGGRSITPSWEWVYGFGPGVEVRFTRNFGLFSDARFLWSRESTSLNTLVFRAGLRITF